MKCTAQTVLGDCESRERKEACCCEDGASKARVTLKSLVPEAKHKPVAPSNGGRYGRHCRRVVVTRGRAARSYHLLGKPHTVACTKVLIEVSKAHLWILSITDIFDDYCQIGRVNV